MSNVAEVKDFFATQNREGKNYTKRARGLLQELEAEQVEKRMAKTKYDMQPLEPGDIVKVTYYESLTSKTESTFQGIIIGKFKGKGIMQAIELRNIIDGVEAEMRIPLLSPLIKDIKLLDRKSKRTRAKLYYLRDRSPQENTFDDRAIAA